MSVQSSLRPNWLLGISVPLLLAITKGPPSLQARLVPKSLDRSQIIKYLTWSVILGIGAQLNSLLSAFALSKYVLGSGRGKAFGSEGWGNEVAVITGGSNGMGALIAQGLASRGIKVAVLDIVEPEYDVDNVYFFSCDISSPKAVKDSAAAVTGFLGVPTILVNNAGIAYAHTILESKPMELRKLFDVNIISHFYTIQAFLPEMIKRKKGHIVSIASMAAFMGVAELTDYCATKAGVLALYEGLNQELKYRYDAPEIKTTIIHPTYVKTALVGPYKNSLREAGALVLEPETVANAVISSIISGQSGQIILPKVFSITSAIRGLPHWFQELARDLTKKDIIAAKATQ